jgi:peptide/nickel transport system permease protein
VIAYVVRRSLWAVLLLVAISLFAFVLFFIVPPETTRVGRGPAATEISLRDSFELQQASVVGQYGEWIWGIVTDGSLGTSYRTKRPVTEMIGDALPVTAAVVIGGTILFLLIAIPIGIVSALRPRSLLDRMLMLFVLVGVSAHPAWIGLILSYFVGYRWGLVPISGYCDLVDPSTSCGGAVDWFTHLILPWFTFAILFAALYARMIRAQVIETYDEDYVRTARAKGAPRWLVLRSHVLRNACLPVVTMLGMDIGLAFAGSVFIEQVYGLPGMGRLAVSSLARRDLPVILGIVLVVTVAIVIFNLIVDLLYTWLDPRVRVHRSRVDLEEADAHSARSGAASVVPAPSTPSS